MKSYVKVIYSSEGASPDDVEKAFMECDFHKLKGSSVFEIEVIEDADLRGRMEKLHDALRGLEVRYMPSIQAPDEVSRDEVPSYRERLEKWRAMGIDVDELIEVLERDVEEFREQAKNIWAVQIDRIADERRGEVVETEAKRRLEEAREGVLREIEMDGKTFHELTQAIDIDTDILSEILDDLVDKGRIGAEQKGRKVVFVTI